MAFRNRHLIRAICLIWSLYTIGVECGVDLSEYWNRTFITDCVFSSYVDRCECPTFAKTRSEWICTPTAFAEKVSKFLIEKNTNLCLNCFCLEFF